MGERRDGEGKKEGKKEGKEKKKRGERTKAAKRGRSLIYLVK